MEINNKKLILQSEKKLISRLIIEPTLLNNIYINYFSEINHLYLITDKDIKLIQFIFNLFLKTQKYRDFKILCKNSFNSKLNNPKVTSTHNDLNILIAKFINYIIINIHILSEYIDMKKNIANKKIYNLLKKLFLTDIISIEDIKAILLLKLIKCLYNEDIFIQNNENKIINNNIKNIKELYLLIDFLLSFKDINLDEEHKDKFIKLVEFLVKNIEKIFFTNNINNIFILSKNQYFFKLIELCRISEEKISNIIIPLLINIYKNKFKIDYIFDDISQQFLLNIKENVSAKTKYLMAKIVFLNMLFLQEEKKLDDITIKNGFIFNNSKNNGIICSSQNVKGIKFPKEGFSIVVSFCLITNNINKKFSIYSFYSENKENFINLYIENNILKIKYDSKIYELFPDIKINKNYIFWMIFPKDKKYEILFYLNSNLKKFLPHMKYPTYEYEKIFIGFNKNVDNDDSIDNFEGAIGTFILFNKCLIENKDDNKNENKLIELKGDYEMIVDIKAKRDFIFVNRNISLILNRFLLDKNDISQFIEVIISTKSLGIIDNEISNDILFNCNYFNNMNSQKNDNSFKYKFKSKDSVLNNITYPFELKNSFLDFLEDYGILYLQLQLYYLLGILSYITKKDESTKNNPNINFSENDIKEINFNLTKIITLFFYCYNSKIYTKDQKQIDNFLYTLNDVISAYNKYGFKIRKLLLSLFINNLQSLLLNNSLADKCEFIFNYDYYDIKDKEIFVFLFQSLSNFIDSYEYLNDKKIIKFILEKIINFDKIYLNENNSISKDSKKKYSQLIQKLIANSLENKEDIFFEIYLKKLKQIKEDFKITLFSWEEDNNSLNFNNYFVEDNNTTTNDFDSAEESEDNKKESRNSSINIKKNKLINVKLLYKYLKNLFVVIDSPKIYKNFINYCLAREAQINSFFNEIFFCFEREFYKNSNIFQNNSNNAKILSELKYSELIKSLCIQFLDIIFSKKNIKAIDEKENKLNKRSSKQLLKSQKNLGSFTFQTLPYSFTGEGSFISHTNTNNIIINSDNNLKHKSIIEYRDKNSFSSTNSSNNYDFLKEGKKNIYLLIKNFEFFNDFILSPFSFLSFFLLLFRTQINNKQKLNLIKNYNSIKIDDLILNEKEFNKSKNYIDLILLLLERTVKQDNNIFMDKFKLFEFGYDLYNGILINTLKYFLKNNSPLKEEILNYLFSYKNNCFYEIVFNSLNYLHNLKRNISINGNEIINRKLENKKEILENLFEKIKNNFIDIINKTIFDIIDPFYFTFLNKLFLTDNKNIDFVIDIISYMINKLIPSRDNEKGNKEEKFNKLIIVELNNKNLLLLIYKIIFYLPRRKKIIKNEKFIKNIFIYLSTFLSSSKLLYIKILFSIDIQNRAISKNRDYININKKLIIEIVFELILEIYLEYIYDTKKIYLIIFEDLLYDVLNIKKLSTHKFNSSIMEEFSKFKLKKKINHTSLYTIDKLSFKKENIFKISEGIKINSEILKKIKQHLIQNYKDIYKEKENIFSICIIFIIKLLIAIRDIDEFLKKGNDDNFKCNNQTNKEKISENNFEISHSGNNENTLHFKKMLISILNQLCKDSLNIYTKYSEINPFVSEGKFNNGLYTYFKSFIIKEFNNEKNYDINNLIQKLSEHPRFLRNYSRVIYNFDGSIILYTYKNYLKNTRIPINNESLIIDIDIHRKENFNDRNYSLSNIININEINDTPNTTLVRNNSFSSRTIKKIKNNKIVYLSSNNINKMNNIKENNIYSINNNFEKKEKDIKNSKDINRNYIKKINFSNDLMRIYFNYFFINLLTYDKDFIEIKKLYKYIINDLPEVDEFNNFDYPQKLKNFIPSDYYVKLFLKKDFNFFDNKCFKYSHKYLFLEQTKKKRRDIVNRIQKNYSRNFYYLFPSKELLKQNDFPNNILMKENSYIAKYYCELLLNRGSIFGKILIFNNGILFLNDVENKKKDLQFACSTLDYDNLNENKKIFILFQEIKEIINRYFCYSWISQEIFLKDGKSYFFNFFTEKNNEDIFEIFKQKKIKILIKNPKEYFEKEEYTKKWKEGTITTYEYLLFLNKLSSRSYNDTNQYPVFPWLFSINNRIRNFDLPVSLQSEKSIQLYKKQYNDYLENNSAVYHSNHYSTSAYTMFYLMRINPFSNNMIKFQSGGFDLPDRQFTTIQGTLELCENYNNNRELIPEIYELPEMYYNINYNDFGRLKDNTRIHNIVLEPYAKNGIEFCYNLKNKINYDFEINKTINLWFDFIFGVNQFADGTEDNFLRLFNEYCYAQNVNIKQIVEEMKKEKKEENKIFTCIKNIVGYCINFGQCPLQILSSPHPLKEYNFKYENLDNYQAKNKDINKMEEIITIKNKDNYKISYFYKNNYNIVYLLQNGNLEIFNLKTKKINKFENILIKDFLNKNILSKFSFCELKEELFIFCGFLDKTIKIFYQQFSISYLLESYVTSIIKIDDTEFVTGHNNGKITKWKLIVNNANNQITLKLEKDFSIKSNNNSITCLEYNKKLNILLSSDNNSIIIRKYYNFEFLKAIQIKKENIFSFNIISLKLSNYNLIYALLELKSNSLYELRCYTINGTFSYKYEGYFKDFELTYSGNIIIGDLNNRCIKILRPYDLYKLHSSSFPFKSNNKNIFHIYYENPNNLYFTIEKNDCTKIQKLRINKSEQKYFI